MKDNLTEQDRVDAHWSAVCHHADTVMYDESNPFTFLLGESVRSIPSALIPEPSTSEWEAAGYSIEATPIRTGSLRHASRQDKAKH